MIRAAYCIQMRVSWFLGLSLLLACRARVTLAQVTLDEIRSGYAQQLDACDSLDVHYRTFATPTGQGEALIPQLEASQVGVANYHWIQQGERWLWELEPSLLRGSDTLTALYKSCDGQKAYGVTFEPGDVSRIREIHIAHGRAETRHAGTELKLLLGLRVSGIKGQSLLDLLDAVDGQTVSREDVDGEACWKVDFGETRFEDERVVTLQVWFDPSKGYLPRQIVSRRQTPPHSEIPGGGITDISETYKVAKYLQSDSGTWFPTHALIFGDYGSQTLIVDSAVFSPAHPRAIFVPEMANGTHVREVDANGNVRRYVVGGGPNIDRAINELSAEVRTVAGLPPPAELNPVVDAAVPSPYRWSWIISGMSLLALASVVALWWRR